LAGAGSSGGVTNAVMSPCVGGRSGPDARGCVITAVQMSRAVGSLRIAVVGVARLMSGEPVVLAGSAWLPLVGEHSGSVDLC
jgi:hypothetical protein